MDTTFWRWVRELQAAESVYRETGSEAALARVIYAEAGLQEELARLRRERGDSGKEVHVRRGWIRGVA